MKTHGIVLMLLLATLSTSAADLLSLLPRDNEIQGWRRKDAPKLYDKTQLWEYIDGGADVYVAFGFTRVGSVELESGTRSIVLDVYEMETREGAFGIYARERAPSYHYLAIGAEGYQEGVSLNFFQDRYYMKLNSFSDDALSKKTLGEIARFVSKKIGTDLSFPPLLTVFPSTGVVPHSETFEPDEYLGRSELRGALTVRYLLSGSRMTAFVAKASSAANAATRTHAIHASLGRSEVDPRAFDGLGDLVLTGKQKVAGELVLVVKGAYIAGVYPVKNTAVVRKVLADVLRRIR